MHVGHQVAAASRSIPELLTAAATDRSFSCAAQICAKQLKDQVLCRGRLLRENRPRLSSTSRPVRYASPAVDDAKAKPSDATQRVVQGQDLRSVTASGLDAKSRRFTFRSLTASSS